MLLRTMAAVLILLGSLVTGARPAAAEERCFAETGACVSGRFAEYWRQNGGLPVFGLPLGPARQELSREDGRPYLTQWFERARLELHPELSAPYDVLLGRLGADLRPGWASTPRDTGPQPGCRWFGETRVNVCDQAPGRGFLHYWQTHGLRIPGQAASARSLALFGLPLTQAQVEISPTDGRPYLTQWFERARFEWHPDQPAPYVVLLGLLGVQALPPQVALDTGALAYVEGGNVVVTRRPDGARFQVTSDGSAGPAVWSPDGQWLAFYLNDGLYTGRVQRDAVRGAVIGVDPPRRLAERAPLAGWVPSCCAPAWAPDSRRIAYISGGDLLVVSIDGGSPVRLAGGGRAITSPAWSPDGARIAYTQRDDSPADEEIYTVPASGGAPTNLSRSPGMDSEPAWSPDGARIAFSSVRDGGFDIYALDVARGQVDRLSFYGDRAMALGAAWSPDGARVAYTRYTHLTSQLDVVVWPGDSVTAGYRGMFTSPAWSPDGEALAVVAGASGDAPIVIIPREGGAARVVGFGQAPAWHR